MSMSPLGPTPEMAGAPRPQMPGMWMGPRGQMPVQSRGMPQRPQFPPGQMQKMLQQQRVPGNQGPQMSGGQIGQLPQQSAGMDPYAQIQQNILNGQGSIGDYAKYKQTGQIPQYPGMGGSLQGFQQQPIMQQTPPIVPNQMSGDAMASALRRQY
jgi:hypothetical protein